MLSSLIFPLFGAGVLQWIGGWQHRDPLERASNGAPRVTTLTYELLGHKRKICNAVLSLYMYFIHCMPQDAPSNLLYEWNRQVLKSLMSLETTLKQSTYPDTTMITVRQHNE